MATLPATEFKARCLELMDRVAERRETFVITKRGKPVAKLVPVQRPSRQSLFGWLRGKAWETGDIVGSTMPDAAARVIENWKGLNGDERPARSARHKVGRAGG